MGVFGSIRSSFCIEDFTPEFGDAPGGKISVHLQERQDQEALERGMI